MDVKEVVLKQQFYLSDEQYNTLKANGSIVIDGETIEYDENADYITPDNTGEQISAVRQDLLVEIQKKADTSYVDEKVSTGGGKLYAHNIIMLWNEGNDYLSLSFLSSRSVPYETVEDFKSALGFRVVPCTVEKYSQNEYLGGLLFISPASGVLGIFYVGGGYEGADTIPDDYEFYDNSVTEI